VKATAAIAQRLKRMEIITVRLSSRDYGKKDLLQDLAIILECEPNRRHQAG
jgi:hypothetical protein